MVTIINNKKYKESNKKNMDYQISDLEKEFDYIALSKIQGELNRISEGYKVIAIIESRLSLSPLSLERVKNDCSNKDVSQKINEIICNALKRSLNH